MNNFLADIPSKKLTVDAIKTQMMYRKKVLRQSPSQAKNFAFSQSGHLFNQEELSQKLATLIGDQMAEPVVEQVERMSE